MVPTPLPNGNRESDMAKDLTFKEFSRINRHRCESSAGFNHKLESWPFSDWVIALVGELGEAANVIKKLNRVRDGIPGNRESPEKLQEKLAGELADAFIYLDLLCQACGVDLWISIPRKFDEKSREIGYPIRMLNRNGDLRQINWDKEEDCDSPSHS